MELQDRIEIVENVRYLLEVQDEPKIMNFIIDTHPADLADIMREMDDEERLQLFKFLETETASEVLLEFDDVTREQIVNRLETSRLSEIVDEMDSDDATDVVASLPDDVAESVLTSIGGQDRFEVEKLLVHEEDTAGGIMALEFIAVYDDETVDDAIQEIRQKSKEVEDVYYVYAIDRGGRLVGIVPLKNLILRNPKRLIKEVMETDFISVTVERDQEDVANLVRKYDMLSVPVVDAYNRLVGRITIDDVMDVVQEEANEDMQRMAGISDEEVLQETSTLRISRNRLPWLFIAFLGEMVSAFIMRSFGASLEKIVWLSFFVPVIMAMGGNTGIQSSTIIIRSISLGEGGATKLWKRLWRELRVGFLIGLIFAALIYLVVFIWMGEPIFGLVLALALLCVLLNASLFGTIIPITLHKLKYDPAIATGPFITTSNDILGLLIYFSLATAFFKLFAN